MGRVSTPFVFSGLGFYGNTGMLVSSMECLQICSGLSKLSRKNHYCGGSLGLRALQPWTREGWWNKCRVISVRWSGPSVFLFVTALAYLCSPLSGPRRGAGLCNLDQPHFSPLNIKMRSSPACSRKKKRGACTSAFACTSSQCSQSSEGLSGY